jgi:hypothetical protein
MTMASICICSWSENTICFSAIIPHLHIGLIRCGRQPAEKLITG